MEQATKKNKKIKIMIASNRISMKTQFVYMPRGYEICCQSDLHNYFIMNLCEYIIVYRFVKLSLLCGIIGEIFLCRGGPLKIGDRSDMAGGLMTSFSYFCSHVVAGAFFLPLCLLSPWWHCSPGWVVGYVQVKGLLCLLLLVTC